MTVFSRKAKRWDVRTEFDVFCVLFMQPNPRENETHERCSLSSAVPACQCRAMSVLFKSGEHSEKLNFFKKVSFEFIFLTISRSIFSFE
jgi:hypothetical protein